MRQFHSDNNLNVGVAQMISQFPTIPNGMTNFGRINKEIATCLSINHKHTIKYKYIWLHVYT